MSFLAGPVGAALFSQDVDRIDHLRAPFSIRRASQIYIAGTLPQVAVDALLPKGLSAAPGNICIMAFLDCPDGWAITPFRGFYCGIVVDGFPAPDGTPGVFLVTGTYSGKAGTHLRHQVSPYLELGGPDFERTAKDVRSKVSLSEGTIAVAAEVANTPEQFLSGTRLYVGLDREDRLRVWTVAFSTPLIQINLDHLSVNLTGRLAPLEDFSVAWSVLCYEKSMTFGEVRFADAAAEQITAQTSLLNVFDRLRRPAALINEDGDVRFVNDEAERNGMSREWLSSHTKQSSFSHFLAELSGARHSSQSIRAATTTFESRAVQVVSVDASLAGPRGHLLLLQGESALEENQTIETLELLGLTPAEARLACQIGKGRSPRTAAGILGITENTARTTLKLVYHKLQLGRQSELARLVARLELM